MKKLTGLLLIVAVAAITGCGPDVEPIKKAAIKDYQFGNISRAKTGFGQVLNAKPSDPDALFYMGVIVASEEKHHDAVYYFRSCLDADPSYSIAKTWLTYEEQAAARDIERLKGPPLNSPYGIQDPNQTYTQIGENPPPASMPTDQKQTPTSLPTEQTPTSMPTGKMENSSSIPEEL